MDLITWRDKREDRSFATLPKNSTPKSATSELRPKTSYEFVLLLKNFSPKK